MEWLRENGIEGKILRLRTKRRSEVFIISDRYGGNESISDKLLAEESNSNLVHQ